MKRQNAPSPIWQRYNRRDREYPDVPALWCRRLPPLELCKEA